MIRIDISCDKVAGGKSVIAAIIAKALKQVLPAEVIEVQYQDGDFSEKLAYVDTVAGEAKLLKLAGVTASKIVILDNDAPFVQPPAPAPAQLYIFPVTKYKP
jgi:hypothetical protein